MLLLDLAEQVQAAVREKVHARSWQVFWHISIDGWTTRETADALNMTYLAVHAAHKRVVDRLAKEGDRRFAELGYGERMFDTNPTKLEVIATMTNCPSEAILRSIGTEAVGEATFAACGGACRAMSGLPECPRSRDQCRSATRPTSRRLAMRCRNFPVSSSNARSAGAERAWFTSPGNPSLKRHVAVKLFPRNSLVDPHAREHWLGEARALSRVPHDHVVAIHRVGETDAWLWLVLEYVSGGTLKDRLAEPLPPRDAARLTETIARAVGYFHSRGVWHLDLKPSNILLGGEPGAPWEVVSPKISDFGIARLDGEPGTTETGQRPQRDTGLHGSRASGRHSRHYRSRRRYPCPGAPVVPLADGPPPLSRSVERGHARPSPPPRPCPPCAGSTAGFPATLKRFASPVWKNPRTGVTPLVTLWPMTCGSGSKAARSRPTAFPRSSTPGAGAAGTRPSLDCCSRWR